MAAARHRGIGRRWQWRGKENGDGVASSAGVKRCDAIGWRYAPPSPLYLRC
jgi:hypothetical protein